MRIFLFCFLLPFILVEVLIAADEPSAVFITEHAELFQWFLGLSIVALGFFLNRTLNTLDKSNSAQWKAISLLTTRLSVLEGSHNALHAGGRRCYDPPARLEDEIK